MQPRIDIDDGGTIQGYGPIASVTKWKSKLKLDRSGDFSFSMPSSDPMADEIAAKRGATCNVMIGDSIGEVGAGIIDKVLTRHSSTGAILRVSGHDMLYELASRQVGDLELYDWQTVTPANFQHVETSGSTELTNAIDGDTGTFVSVTLEAGEFLYWGNPSRFQDIYLDLGPQFNAQAVTVHIQYFDGSGWIDISHTDGTESGGDTLAQDGTISFTIPAGWQQPMEHEGVTQYWLRMYCSATIDTVDFRECTIEEVGPTATALSEIMAYAPSGWSLDTVTGHAEAGSSVYLSFNGETVLAALCRLAEQTGEHFRLGDGREVVWLQDDQADSGIRLVGGHAADPVSVADNDDVAIITQLEKSEESYERFSRIYPYGAGFGPARVTLASTTQSAPAGYTLDVSNNYLKHDATESAIGRYEKAVQFKDVVPLDVDTSHDEQAADALFDAAYEWLARHKDNNEAYDIKVTGLATALNPGDTVRVVYKRVIDGYTEIDIDDDLVILEVTNEITAAGAQTVGVKCSTIDIWPDSGTEFLSGHVRSMTTMSSHSQPVASTVIVTTVENSDLYVPKAGGVMTGALQFTSGGVITAEIAADGDAYVQNFEVQGTMTAALDMGGFAITNVGNVDGVDISALKTDVDGFPDELKNLTTAEIQQLENIGAVTISAAQWGYVGSMDQGVDTGDSVQFAGLTVEASTPTITVTTTRASGGVAFNFFDLNIDNAGGSADWANFGVYGSADTNIMNYVFLGDAYNDAWQTWSDSEVAVNQHGSDIDFRVESDTLTHALFVRGSDGNVGIGHSSPSYGLDVYQKSLGVHGTAANWSISSTGVTMSFTRPSANYIMATQSGGYFAFCTNAAASGLAPSTLAMLASYDVVVPNGGISIGKTTAPSYALDVVGGATFSDDVDPTDTYTVNLGSITKKYLTLHAAELWVSNLVAQDVMATIGGRILVGPTTYLTSAITSTTATTIYVEHNDLAANDYVILETSGKYEQMLVTAGPSGTGPYSYTVTRNVDGSGGNTWNEGDAVFSMGAVGEGWIDLYSVRGVDSGGYGPTIVGNVTATGGSWVEHWAIGNLNGIYGYSTDTYGVGLGKYETSHLTIDPTDGLQFYAGSAVVGSWDPGGDVIIGEVATNKANLFWDESAGRLNFRGGTDGEEVEVYIDTDGSITAGGGDVIINSDGLSTEIGTTVSQSSALYFTSSSVMQANVGASLSSGTTTLQLYSATNPGGNPVYMWLQSSSSLSRITLYATEITTPGHLNVTDYITASGGIWIGQDADPGTDNLIVDGATRIGTGLYVGSTGTAPDADDIHFDGNLKSVKSSTTYDVYAFHPLSAPLTNTSFDGDSFSDVGTATKIENTSWSSAIPADAKALLIQIIAADSGAGDNWFAIGPTSTYWYAMSARPVHGSDYPNENTGPVPCTDGDIYYRVEASGTSTMDVWLRCWGYWI